MRNLSFVIFYLFLLLNPLLGAAQSFISGTTEGEMKSGLGPLFGKDIEIFSRPERNQRGSDIIATFNGWLYAANTNDNYPNMRITFFRSQDNGMTWDSLTSCCEAYENEVIPKITLSYTGNSESNLKIFACWFWFNTILHASMKGIAKINGITGVYEIIWLWDDSSPNDATIKNNQSYNGADIIAFLEDYNWFTGNVDLLMYYSIDEGNSYSSTKVIQYMYPKKIMQVSLSYGYSPAIINGRFFAAWRVDDSQNSQMGRIYTAHSEPLYNSSFTTPICLDSLVPADINQCRSPFIVCQNGEMVNDSGNVTTIILYEKVDNISGKTDIKGFYNLQSTTSGYFRPFTFTNSSHHNVQADAEFNPFDSTFVITWYDSTDQKLRSVRHDMNMVNPNSWINVSTGYNDQPVTKTPYPRITINPVEQSAAYTWNGERENGNGVQLFDAIYSTYTSIHFQKDDNFLLKSYPNPCSDSFTLEMFSDKAQKVEVELYSVLGTRIKHFGTYNCQNGLNTFSLEDIEIPDGTYVLRVSNNDIQGHCILVFKK